MDELAREALEQLEKISDLPSLEQLKASYLGKKGRLTALMRRMDEISSEDRPTLGQVINRVKNELTQAFGAKSQNLAEGARKKHDLDVTLPGRKRTRGHKHLITRTTDDISQIFTRMGFDIAEGPEIETDYYCFDVTGC